MRRLRNWACLALTALMIALLLVYSGYIRRAFMRPIALLMQRMREAPDEGDAALRNVPKDEFAAIYQQYDEMIKRNDRLIHENYQAVYRTRIAELRQLQYQIRPHFLYNSLFLLYRMAQSAHCEDIADYASHLGSYYQYITRFADHEVSIEQEIEHIQNYVNIQKLRFGDRIAVEMSELPGEARGMSIAALVLQPLVENAYEHGLKDKLADGRLRILMRWEEGGLLFSVEDNGAGMDEEAIARLLAEIERADILEEARGLANTNLRLVMRYGPESRLNLLNLPEGGFRASVRIPRSDGPCTTS